VERFAFGADAVLGGKEVVSMYSSTRISTVRVVLALAAFSAVTFVRAHAQQHVSCPSIRSADGSCADAATVAAAGTRATVMSSAFASFGTPQGKLGQSFIPHERLFRDSPIIFGLPTNTIDILEQKNVRSK
jgi:hypothetical protein